MISTFICDNFLFKIIYNLISRSSIQKEKPAHFSQFQEMEMHWVSQVFSTIA